MPKFDIISHMLNVSYWENGLKDECHHKFSIESCNEEGLAVCSECGIGFDELRHK